jgi:hypothetical protein
MRLQKVPITVQVTCCYKVRRKLVFQLCVMAFINWALIWINLADSQKEATKSICVSHIDLQQPLEKCMRCREESILWSPSALFDICTHEMKISHIYIYIYIYIYILYRSPLSKPEFYQYVWKFKLTETFNENLQRKIKNKPIGLGTDNM